MKKARKKTIKRAKRREGSAIPTESRFEIILEGIQSDFQAFSDDLDGIREDVGSVKRGVDGVREEVAGVRAELALIRHDLKQKVDREEFKVLELRVARLESLARK